MPRQRTRRIDKKEEAKRVKAIRLNTKEKQKHMNEELEELRKFHHYIQNYYPSIVEEYHMLHDDQNELVANVSQKTQVVCETETVHSLMNQILFKDTDPFIGLGTCCNENPPPPPPPPSNEFLLTYQENIPTPKESLPAYKENLPLSEESLSTDDEQFRMQMNNFLDITPLENLELDTLELDTLDLDTLELDLEQYLF